MVSPNYDSSDKNREIFLYDPRNRDGTPTFFNWPNFTVSEIPESYVDSKNNPGQGDVYAFPWFATNHPALKWITEHPKVSCGYNQDPDAGKNKEGANTSSINSIHHLFENKKITERGWITEWYGYYNPTGKDWYQFWNTTLLNYPKHLEARFQTIQDISEWEVYPFATKGVAFTIYIDEWQEFSLKRGKGDTSLTSDNRQMGHDTNISRMWGLWVDLDGGLYSYELHCNGDNRGFGWADSEDKEKRRLNNNGYWGDPYRFHRTGRQVKKASKRHVKDFLKRGEYAGIVATTRENVENLYFLGCTIMSSIGYEGNSMKSHHYQISQMSPVPFVMPYHTNDMCVLGQPTAIKKLREKNVEIAQLKKETWSQPDSRVVKKNNGDDSDETASWSRMGGNYEKGDYD